MTARILIVDDVPANIRLLQTRLESEYFQVAAARDGFEALALAARFHPDLILLDVMMPGMDGFECCRRLKANPDTAHVPVIMVTALGATAERLRGLEAGADDFLTKPVWFGTLLARLRGLVRLKRLLDEWCARAATVRALGLANTAEEPISIAGSQVLVIDDWDSEAELIADALTDEGLVVHRATSAADAETIALAGDWDLVVLSLSLADEDPLRLASRLRASEGTQYVPLLLLADRGEPEQSLRAFDLGASDWVLQPVDANELRVRARNQVQRKLYQDGLRSALGEALELAVTDPLTGLYNRRYMLRHLRGLLHASPAPQLSVLMVDVDHFKVLNDQLGHAAGDRALQAIASVLRANTRAFDTLARIGGEEFLLLMPGTGAQEASGAAERLRAAIAEQPFEWPRPGMAPLTISIGIASTGEFGTDLDQLLAAADSALYEAKRAGRDQVCVAERVRLQTSA
jgi:two-component system, cell cycle response regulator